MLNQPSRITVVFVTLIPCTLALVVADAAAQGDQGRVIGRVTDSSGASLPGVAVTIASEPSQPVLVVTDGAGQYLSPPVPPATYTVSFELAGFNPRQRNNVRVRAGEVLIVNGDMTLAPVSELVEVVALAPPVEESPLLKARRFPVTRAVPPEVLASVCGPGQPSRTAAAISAVGTIAGHRDERDRTLFGDSDVLLLDIGHHGTAAVGQNLAVRRRFRVGDKSAPLPLAEFGEHTAGLLQVVDVMDSTAIAVVIYACGELLAGDSVELFDPLPAVVAQTAGAPDYDSPARIILGEQGREIAAPQQLMVIDRGSADGAQRGQRLTVFRRRARGGSFVAAIADAVIVAVRERSATIRIEHATDAVSVGDQVALHHQR